MISVYLKLYYAHRSTSKRSQEQQAVQLVPLVISVLIGEKTNIT